MKPRALALALAAVPTLVVGCHLPQAHVYNLREVRDPDGSARRIGAPMDVSEYIVRHSILLALESAGTDEPTVKEPEVIEDPDGIALEHLILLGECDRSDPYVLGLQIEMAAWLAIDDGYRLARERAVIELGVLGREIGLDAPLVLAPDEVAASPDDLVGPLGDLVRGVRLFVQDGLAPGEEFAASCEAIHALVLDRNGARRVVAATNALLEQAGHDAPEMAPLAELFRRSALRAVGLALGAALSDPDPLVRGAAVEAALVTSDDALIVLRLQALEDPEEEVLISVLRGIRDRGLTMPDDATEMEALRLETLCLDRMVALTRDLRSTVSYAACASLIRVSGSGIESYRWEDWTRWWESEVPARETALNADRAGD